MNRKINIELVRYINEDLTRHKDYLHRLYTRSLLLGALVISTAFAVIIWFSSDQLTDGLIVQHLDIRIDSRVGALVKLTAKKHESTATDDLAYRSGIIIKRGLRAGFQGYIDGPLNRFVRHYVSATLNAKYQGNEAFPNDAILDFYTENCPPGWLEHNRKYRYFTDATSPTGSLSYKSALLSPAHYSNLYKSKAVINQVYPDGFFEVGLRSCESY